MTIVHPPTPTRNGEPSREGGGIPVQITVNGAQRTAGYAMPNHYWFRRMERSKHFLQRPRLSIAAGTAALAEAVRLGSVALKVLDSESGDTFLCTVDDLHRYGYPVQRPGWEPQIALALEHWTIIHRDGSQELPIHQRTAQPAEPEDMQLSLFGGA